MTDPRTCIMIGPTRTATTSLFRFFADAEGVAGSKRKETNWFLREILPDLEIPERSYDECFRSVDGARARLEASPLYFMFGKRLADLIRAAQPDAHIVITLREPVERFFSAWTMINNKRNVALKIDRRYSDDELFRLCRNASADKVNSFAEINCLTLAEGLYGRLIAEWLSVFPREQVHFVFYDWIADERFHPLIRRTVFDALGLPQSRENDSLFHENKSRDVRNKLVHKAAFLANERFEQFLNRHKRVRDVLRDVYYHFNEAGRERPDPATVAAVEQYYRADLGDARTLLQGDVDDRPSWLG